MNSFFLKNEKNLKVNQRETREKLSKMNLKSMKALLIRKAFQNTYKAETYEEFEKLLKQWNFREVELYCSSCKT